jgi:3-methyladenine DNA glycosylase AlkC
MSESSTAFKNLIDQKLLKRLGRALEKADSRIDGKELTAVAKKLDDLELKARVKLVSATLHGILPKDFERAAKILLRSAKDGDLSGFALWPYTDFVQTYGLEHFDASMNALKELTQLFTSEFAIRPFILKNPDRTLAWLKTQLKHPSPHVRRWISEGTRPRLPWGERLTNFIKDPRPGLELLEELKYDDEVYVRKSVANHLNDVSKDHPELLLRTLTRWNKEAPPGHKHHEKIRWITRHSTRTLVKAGHPGALKLAGVEPNPKVRIEALKLTRTTCPIGEELEFHFHVTSTARDRQKLIIDYIVHYQKANGATSPKVFKLKTVTIEPRAQVKVLKAHSLKPVSVRKLYPGAHALEIQVNGKIVARQAWTLVD